MKTRTPRLTTLIATVAVAAFGMLVSDFAAAQAAGGNAPAAAPARPGQGAGYGPGYGAGWHARQIADAASTPRGAGAGWGQPGPRGGRRGQAGPDFTPGWTLMTPQEREQHRTAMAQTKSYEECVAVMTQQRQQLAERAQAKGVAVPTPRRDACAALKP